MSVRGLGLETMLLNSQGCGLFVSPAVRQSVFFPLFFHCSYSCTHIISVACTSHNDWKGCRIKLLSNHIHLEVSQVTSMTQESAHLWLRRLLLKDCRVTKKMSSSILRKPSQKRLVSLCLIQAYVVSFSERTLETAVVFCKCAFLAFCFHDYVRTLPRIKAECNFNIERLIYNSFWLQNICSTKLLNFFIYRGTAVLSQLLCSTKMAAPFESFISTSEIGIG